jgi:hypothetical protein
VLKDAIAALPNTIEGADCAILSFFAGGLIVWGVRGEKRRNSRDTYMRQKREERGRIADMPRASTLRSVTVGAISISDPRLHAMTPSFSLPANTFAFVISGHLRVQ